MSKYTRAEVLHVAKHCDMYTHENGRLAAAMLRDLAPPDEPRAWKVGDLLRLDGRAYCVVGDDDGTVMIASFDGGLRSWKKMAELADAVPLKLVEDV